MQKKLDLQNILLLNFAMLCISTSGALGRYISMSPPLIIWWRALFALFFLGIFCWGKNLKFRFDRKRYGSTFFITGALMAIHWVTYFYALKWANVAVGMLSIFTYPIMTSFLEPIILRTKFQKHHIILGLMVLFGIYFLAPTLSFDDSMTQGLLMGLLSALAYSIRNILLKTQVQNFNGSMLMFYQMFVTVILLSPVLFIEENILVVSQVPFILFLGLVTTSIGHTLFLNSFKNFSISTASIMSSVQPLYGILIAIVFLAEIPPWRSWIGGAIILSTVVIETVLSSRKQK